VTVFLPDVSEFQDAVSNAYTRDWLSFRVCDGTYHDHKVGTNLPWSKKAASSGRLTGFIGYCVYRPGVDTFGTYKAIVGAPHPKHVAMIDVESWGGAIRGDHSAAITALANQLAAWLGSKKRVIAYGNAGDLASIYPHRPSWLKVIVASYGPNRPSLPGMIGWQYTDGSTRYGVPAGYPRSSAPFGACDHNAFDMTSAQLATTLGISGDWFDMATEADLAKAVHDGIAAFTHINGDTGTHAFETVVAAAIDARLDAIAHKVWNSDVVPVGHDPKNPTWYEGSVISALLSLAAAARDNSAAASAKVDAVAQVLSNSEQTGVLDRLAALQAAVKALTPSAAAAVDVQSIVNGVAAVLPNAVAEKVKAISWKAAA
jgi:hypothetical protein